MSTAQRAAEHAIPRDHANDTLLVIREGSLYSPPSITYTYVCSVQHLNDAIDTLRSLPDHPVSFLNYERRFYLIVNTVRFSDDRIYLVLSPADFTLLLQARDDWEQSLFLQDQS